jgi:hypothetical protein
MIGGFIGRLFGSEKAIESAVDGVKSGLDKLIYTKEERAEDAAKAVTEARSTLVEWMKNSQGQNIARRFLAMMIAFTWLVQYIVGLALSMAIIWSDPVQVGEEFVTNPQLLASSEIISTNVDSMTGAMMLILGFYFAAPHLSKVVDGAMQRFGKT